MQLQNENDQVPLNFAGNISIVIGGLNTSSTMQPIFYSAEMVDQSGSGSFHLCRHYSAQIEKVIFYRAIDWSGSEEQKTLSVSISIHSIRQKVLAKATLLRSILQAKRLSGDLIIPSHLKKSINIAAGHTYLLKIQLIS